MKEVFQDVTTCATKWKSCSSTLLKTRRLLNSLLEIQYQKFCLHEICIYFIILYVCNKTKEDKLGFLYLQTPYWSH